MTQVKIYQAAPELLPCKCGWRPVVHGSFDMGYLIAHDCEHVAAFRTSDNERGPVIAAWNRRADLAAPSAPAEVEGLVELLKDAAKSKHIAMMWPCVSEAATVLTAQQAEIAKMRKADEILQGLYEIEKARAEKAEADLAREELSHNGTIKQRDFAERWADKLAYAIGGDAIGEHSSTNNPWSKALAKLKGDV